MRWYTGSIVQAVQEAKQRKAVFVVFVQGKDDSSKKMKELIDDSRVAGKLEVESNFVAITLESGTEAYTQFAQIYQLVPVPSLFFIGNNGTPLEVILGGADIDTLISKINNVLTKSGKPLTTESPQPSTAASSSSKFIAGEQKQTEKVATPPKADDVEYEVVCDGDTCVRKPKQKAPEEPKPTPEPASDTSSSSGDTSAAQLSLDEKVERAKQLLEEKRRAKEEEEKQALKQKELERRAQGQGVAELKRWQEDQELKNLKEERLREKKENEKARQKILEQIAQDKINRQARFAAAPAVEKTTPVSPPAPVISKSDDNVTRIQFKMADGSAHHTRPSSDSTLGELRKYVKENIVTVGAFTLSVSYPRQLLDTDQDAKTLRDLNLTPSSTILVIQGAGGGSPGGGSGPSPVAKATGFFTMISHLLWAMFVQPAQDLFGYINNWFSGNRPPASGSSTPASASSGRTLGGASSSSRRPEPEPESSVKRRKVGGQGGSGVSVIKKEGNTYRLRDRDSDDENNTWNGNSTQQM